MIELDGSVGEGGGQIIRSALSASMITGQGFHLVKIRQKRNKPGLLRQHLTCVKAAAEICGAQTVGAEAGSTELTFKPKTIQAGNYHYAVGTAGSTTLVLQTILPALLCAEEASEVVIEGGTHNMAAPPVDFIQHAFLPQLRKMGAEVDLKLEAYGFYPAGGGRIRARIQPAQLKPLKVLARDAIKKRRAVARIADLPDGIAERELRTVGEHLDFRGPDLQIDRVQDSLCPGNVLHLFFESKQVTEVITSFGKLGLPAKAVAEEACKEAKQYLKSNAPIGRKLVDQLLLPMAIAGGGSIRTYKPTQHTRTNIPILEAFFPVRFELEKRGDGIADIHVKET